MASQETEASGLWAKGNVSGLPTADRDVLWPMGTVVHTRQASRPGEGDDFLHSCLRAVRHGRNPIRFVAVRRVLWQE